MFFPSEGTVTPLKEPAIANLAKNFQSVVKPSIIEKTKKLTPTNLQIRDINPVFGAEVGCDTHDTPRFTLRLRRPRSPSPRPKIFANSDRHVSAPGAIVALIGWTEIRVARAQAVE